MPQNDSGAPAANYPPQPLTAPAVTPNVRARLSLVFAMIALALYVVVFLVLWFPVYAFESNAGLLLWPIALLVLLIVCVLAILAIVQGAGGLSFAGTGDGTGRSSAASRRNASCTGVRLIPSCAAISTSLSS